MNSIKLALVEDQILFRQGLLSLLKEFPELEVILEADNGKIFTNKIKGNVPEVVLLDLGMPVMDGFETTIFLKKNYPDIKIVILTQENSDEAIIDLIEKGAHGFLLKNNSIETIIDAIHGVIDNGFYFNDRVSQAMVKRVMIKDKIKPRFNKTDLSEREMEILKLVSKEFGNSEIGEQLFIDARTVERHKQNIIKKTGAKNIIGAVVYAIKNDLV